MGSHGIVNRGMTRSVCASGELYIVVRSVTAVQLKDVALACPDISQLQLPGGFQNQYYNLITATPVTITKYFSCELVSFCWYLLHW